MCRQIECSRCNKPTFAGCGMHVEQVLGHVPRDERCDCSAKVKSSKLDAVVEPSLFRRILGG